MALRDYVKAGIEVVRDFTDLVKARTEEPDNNKPNEQALKIEKAQEDPKTLFFDPYAVIDQMGYKDKASSISYGTLWQMFMRMPVIQSIVILRKNQIASFALPQQDRFSLGFKVALRDEDKNPTKQELKWAQDMSNILLTTGVTNNPKGRDSFKTFLKKLVSDTLIYDQMCFEIVNNRKGLPCEWYATDATTMRIADNGDTFIDEDLTKEVRYVQIYDGIVINEYTADEMVFGVRNPNTNIRLQGYGISELELLITTITGLLNGHDYNSKFFTQGSTAKGIINFKGTVPNRQLAEFKRHWYNLLSGAANCVSGSTNIWTDKGGYSISELLGIEEEKEVNIWTGTSWKEALVYRTNKEKQVCITTLGNNVDLHTSPDHKFRTIDDSGVLCWKRQKDLKVGDYVAVNNTIVENKEWDIPAYNGKPISLELMEIFGWLMGDGNIGKNTVALYYNDKETWLRDKHLKILKEYEPVFKEWNIDLTEEEIVKIKNKKGFKSVQAHRKYSRCCSAEFTRWLLSLGFRRKKVIPYFVYALPIEYKKSFLRGFFSADGNNHKLRQPCITITDPIKREQTKQLLLSMGIRTCFAESARASKTIYPKNEKPGTIKDKILRIKDKDKFFKEIGFLQDHKQPKDPVKVNEIGKSSKIAKSTVNYYLGLVRSLNNDNKKLLLTKRERMDMNSILSGSDGCSLPRLLRYMQKVDLPIPSWFKSIIN